MKYTLNDIPYLVGLHFVLSNTENYVTYLIHSHKGGYVYIDWPHRGDQRMASYTEMGFLHYLNSGSWIITDLPDVSNIDISSVIKEEVDSSYVPKVDDVLVAKHDVFYEDGKHERFVTKDKHYYIIDVSPWHINDNRYTIINDNGDRHTLTLGYLHKHFYLLDGSVNMEDVFTKLYESEDVGDEPELKAGDVVYFKNNEERPYDEEEFKVGKPYQIDYISYRGDVIEIFNERGYASEFTIYPDYNGFSFKSWFTIIPPDIQNTDFFSKLYESEEVIKERGKILKFNPRPTPEEEQMIYNRLTEMYPSIRWSSSGEKLSNRSYSRMGLDTIFIENNTHVTWGAGPDADEVYLESPHRWDLYDGWNFINGKSTSEIFDTLYEQEDDGLGWAKETVKTPITLGSLWEYKTLNVGDVVALYGDVMDSERVLFILTGENFVVEDIQYKKEVYRIGDNLDDINRILFKWLKPIQERPINWKSAASGNSFEVDSSTISNDGKILVQFISRAQKE